jgi:two-component system, chemotaxis family, chemotaxis protein CheY
MPLRIVKFLVVDDHKLSRAIVFEALRAVGATRVRQADDGNVAVQMLADEVPDIAIIDIRMPHDGLTLLRHIRTSPGSPDRMLPVIMLTAYTERGRIESLRDAGATEVVTKPMSVHALFRRVASVIDSPRPFVTSETYIGPCRRRRAKPNYAGPRRRASERDEIDVA